MLHLQEGCGFTGESAEEMHQDVFRLGDSSYEERLDGMDPFYLEQRKLRGDPTEIYQIMR